MRYLLILLLFPFVAPCQTVHVDDDHIVYNGSVKTTGLGQPEIFNRAKASIMAHVKSNDLQNNGDSSITTKGIIFLSSSFSTIKKLHYQMILTAGSNGYHYTIDSVFLSERQRGEKEVLMTSKDLFKNMEVSGPVAMSTESQLNEIDMRIQQLLDFIKNDIIKTSLSANISE